MPCGGKSMAMAEFPVDLAKSDMVNRPLQKSIASS